MVDNMDILPKKLAPDHEAITKRVSIPQREEIELPLRDEDGRPLSAREAATALEGQPKPQPQQPVYQTAGMSYPRRVTTTTTRTEEDLPYFKEDPYASGVQGYQEGGPTNPEPPWPKPQALPPGQQTGVAEYSQPNPSMDVRRTVPYKDDSDEREIQAEELPQSRSPLLGLPEHGALKEAEERIPLNEDEVISEPLDLQKPTGLGFDEGGDDIINQALRSQQAQPEIVPTEAQLRGTPPSSKISASPGVSGSSGVYRLSAQVPFRKSFATVHRLPSDFGSMEIIKSADGRSYFIQGYASSTDRDRDGDRFSTSALQDMAEQAPGLNLYADHTHDNEHMLGTITQAQVSGNKLWFEAKMKDPETNPLAREVIETVTSGLNLSFSIGGDLSESHMEGDTRVLDKAELYEVSVVPLPSNPHAVVTGLEFKGRR